MTVPQPGWEHSGFELAGTMGLEPATTHNSQFTLVPSY